MRAFRLKEKKSSLSIAATLFTALDLYYTLIQEQQNGSQILIIKETESGRTEREIYFI